MSLKLGLAPRRARAPQAWRDALPGMSEVSGPGLADLLAELRAGRLDAVALPAARLVDAFGGAAQDLAVGATPVRPEPRDVLVPAEGAPTLAGLPPGARVALSGRRRRALLAVHRPDLEAVGLPSDPRRTAAPFLRGGGADAVILAAHQARAAGISARASEVLDAKAWLPGPGQAGSVFAVRRGDDATRQALEGLHHAPTGAALEAEAAVARGLGLGAGSALGALALPYGRWLRLWAMLPSVPDRRLVRGDLSGSDGAPGELGTEMAALLLRRGAAFLPGFPGGTGSERAPEGEPA